VALPKNIQQVCEADLNRIKLQTDHLAVVSDLTIVRGLRCATCIANRSSYDTGDTPEPGVDAPESAEGKESMFSLSREALVKFREHRPIVQVFLHHGIFFRECHGDTCAACFESP